MAEITAKNLVSIKHHGQSFSGRFLVSFVFFFYNFEYSNLDNIQIYFPLYLSRRHRSAQNKNINRLYKIKIDNRSQTAKILWFICDL